ncbi:MAG: J domain-containing protein [Bacteroidetes bacterium]|nr:J domain-containing protein [Bacteroidota bacterium]MBU1114272.1 J domain-containing protein [Bacteroidota bacterium]MBU1797664.1 J domain-containing protein [Bacteroidota bacterium]
MSNISGMRNSADYLYEQQKPYEASIIYGEVYRQIWNSIGSIYDGINDFSKKYLPKKVMTSIEFKNHYIYEISSTTFYQWFRMDSDQVLNEFISTLSGHLKCISYSKTLINNVSKQDVLNDFLVLYTLIDFKSDESWVDQVLKFVPPKFDPNQLDKARPNLLQTHVEKKLTKLSSNIITTNWNHLNFLLVDYLMNKGERNSLFYNGILKSIGKRPSNYSNNYKTNEQSERQSKKNEYEKYERYERFERYEKYEKYNSHSKPGFDSKTATEEQKYIYYGKLLDLKGTVQKKEIRKKYLKLVGQYHPDKVESLGLDLRTLAEERTKELNEAYEWIKNKYNL